MKPSSAHYIAKILRTDKNHFIETIKFLENLTGNYQALDKIKTQLENSLSLALINLGLSKKSLANEVFQALLKKTQEAEEKVTNLFYKIDFSSPDSLNEFTEIFNKRFNYQGLFLKEDKAQEILKNHPPKHLLNFLGYSSIEEAIIKEGLYQIYASLRFSEPADWLNKVFLPAYKKITPNDFEKRAIKIIALDSKWSEITKNFIEKKYHNLTHLKELGLICILPEKNSSKGMFLRFNLLLFHYFYEIEFYSLLFEFYKEKREDFFAELMIKALKGEIIEKYQIDPKKWLIIPRYLAKEDEWDFRLFYPRINPEALHWDKAIDSLIEFYKELNIDLTFWKELNWIGGYFLDENEIPILISFNLIDNAMSLVKEKLYIKYFYHLPEAIWNKIIIEFLGEDKVYKLLLENLEKGFLDLTSDLDKI